MTTHAEAQSPNAVTMDRNLHLAGAFTRTVLSDPSVMDNIPQGATLIFCLRTTRHSSKPTFV
jgi:hypothetical protein